MICVYILWPRFKVNWGEFGFKVFWQVDVYQEILYCISGSLALLEVEYQVSVTHYWHQYDLVLV